MTILSSYMQLAKLRARRHGHIGLLGGSFNPAHVGHAHIADVAARELKLDQVFWLVSPQNPLKPKDDMAPFATRFTSAETMARQCHHQKRMHVSALEHASGFRFTADTVRFLATTCPRITFYWLMGADNLAQFHQWHRTDLIIRYAYPIVINRPGYQAAAINSRIANRMLRLGARQLRHRSRLMLNRRYWAFIHSQLISISATDIRASMD